MRERRSPTSKAIDSITLLGGDALIARQLSALIALHELTIDTSKSIRRRRWAIRRVALLRAALRGFCS